MSNYPEGSMRGSGIYSYDYEDEVTCENELEDGTYCDFEGTILVWVDDWSRHSWECPKCKHEHERDDE